ncbi:hypothetical protein DESC_500090 [Desulfosarcina cetonica]|nr:hypothetical protein DESC_500090 [Desulfosarcina cetonica]
MLKKQFRQLYLSFCYIQVLISAHPEMDDFFLLSEDEKIQGLGEK